MERSGKLIRNNRENSESKQRKCILLFYLYSYSTSVAKLYLYLLFVVSFYLLSGKLYVIFAYVEPLISPRSPECYLWLVNLQVSKLLIPREYTLPWLSEVFCLKHLGASSYPRWISRISHHLSALSSANNACFNFLPRFLYFSFQGRDLHPFNQNPGD